MAITVGCYLVDLLAANDIDTVFGIPGVHTLELYRGLAAAKLRHVLVRHEQGAGFAADGFARISGRAAAAFVISGPGLTNILTAVGQAYSDSVPLLVIASTPVRESLDKQWGVLHEMKSQDRRRRRLRHRAHGRVRRGRSRSSARLPRKLARRPTAPGLPRDSARFACGNHCITRRALRKHGRCAGRGPGANRRRGTLARRRAKRPLIVAGGGARGAARNCVRSSRRSMRCS
jgi:5-guanidino-2-oxopentanoate decarboxylase